MSEFEYIRQTTLRSIKRNFLQHCNLSNNEAIKVWANWVIVNRIREKQVDEFLPTENLELDNKTVSLLIEKGLNEDDAINFYSNFIQQCHRWKHRYEYYRADKINNRDYDNRLSREIDEDSVTLNVLDDFTNVNNSSVSYFSYPITDKAYKFPPGLPIQVNIVYNSDGLSGDDKMISPSLSGSGRESGTETGRGRDKPNLLISSLASSLTSPIPSTPPTFPTLPTPLPPIPFINKELELEKEDIKKVGEIEVELIIDYRGISNKIDSKSLRRLLDFYNGSPRTIKFCIWKLLNSYALLDGLSYQWSLPPETFKLLFSNCKLKAELFASPLNHHVKNYYSLFDIDREFGSSGDFFSSTYRDFANGGFYEANPPFIESVFIQASQLILNYLELARQNNSDLIFMWIMPDWLDSFAYQRLKTSMFMKTEIILRKGQHKYWEYRKNRLIQANFNTHVLILSSNDKCFGEFWPFDIQDAFIRSMSY